MRHVRTLAPRARTRVAVAGLLVALTGCSSDSEGRVDDRAQQEVALAQRPTAEQEVARLTRARGAVRERLATELGLTAWSDRGNANSAGCADYPASRGTTSFVSSLGLAGGVPDEGWPRAAELVVTTAADYGFGSAETVVDEPGQHEIVLRGERGSRLRFSTLTNATVAMETGCHLPAAIAADVRAD